MGFADRSHGSKDTPKVCDALYVLATVERWSRRYDDKAQFLHSNIGVVITHGKQYNSSDPDPAALLLSAQKHGINLLFAFHYAQIVGIMDIVTALGIKFIFSPARAGQWLLRFG